jgi:hypothetical protein
MRRLAQAQRGAVAILYAMLLLVLLGCAGLAIDLALLYQRKEQLQQAVDSMALAAALQLDGSAAGVSAARSKAEEIAVTHQIRGDRMLVLSDAALTFSSDGGASAASWLSYSAALAAPAGLHYARVDSAQLAPDFGQVAPFFMGVLNAALASASVAAAAVAGPRAIDVLPLAICAMSASPSAVRANGGVSNELVEYGFRYGVTYNLLNLNPAAGAGSGEYFLVDPLAPPGMPGAASNTDATHLAPFMCSGQLAYTRVSGGTLSLRRSMPFALANQLNSRFDMYGGSNACVPAAAPPDSNVRSYAGAGASWMGSAPSQPSALASTPAAGQPLRTIADLTPPLVPSLPGKYGVLWAYGAARRSSGGNFATTSWNTLYPAAPTLSASGWSAATPPYHAAAFSTAPSQPGRKGRRVLNVPLLACPVAAGATPQASVLAIGRFLLTAPASAAEVPGEFAGVVDEATLTANVELIR